MSAPAAAPPANAVLRARLTGELDVTALSAAVEDLVAARPELAAAGERPGRVRLRVIDLSRSAGEQQRRVLADLAADEAARPVGAAGRPRLRACLAGLGAGAYELLLALDRERADAWSVAGLTRELGAAYRARTPDAPAPPPAAGPVPGAGPSDARSAGVRSAGARSAGAWLSGGRASRTVPGQPGGATAERVLAAFATVLGRYAGTDEAVVTVPVPDEALVTVPEVAAVPDGVAGTAPDGPAVRVIRLDLPGDLTFARLGAAVRTAPQAGADGPAFPIRAVFTPHGLPAAALDLPGIAAEVTVDAPPDPEGRLTLALTGPDEFTVVLTGTLPGRVTAAGFADHVVRAVRFGLDTPDRPLAELDLSGRPAPYPAPAPAPATARPYRDHLAFLDEEFTARVREAPEAVAVRSDEGTLDYRGLDRWSHRIARALAAHGAGPGQVVALLPGGGAAQIAAVLGATRTGATFTCLNPADPDARLRDILAGTGAVCVLADPAAAAAHPALLGPDGRFAGLPVLPLEPAPGDDPPGGHVGFPAPPVADHPLCIVHTSGSTGTPKGIALSRAAFAQFAEWQRERFGIGPGSRVAQWAPLTYDAAYTEVFAALTAGAELCLPPAAARRDPVAVVRWLRQERIGQIQTVPSFFRLLTEALDAQGGELPDLRHVLIAGEVFPVDLAEAWAHRAVRPGLHNLYGPTECILATHHELPPGGAYPAGVPIGGAIPGREVLVLDGLGRPCPVGVPGEIHLRSPFLAGSYHRRPAETAAAYLPDPWRPGRTLYRTGDRGYWRADGTLAFTGRTGNQVKIRGNRVELDEVEAVLEQQAGVREAAAAVRTTASGDPCLVGYVVADPGVSGEALRRLVAARLPAPAVPDLIAVLADLPRTATNKRDRARLPWPLPARRSDPEGDGS
ncbi:amino acid adenylation domain-containing protein [Kitasatospora sp. NPDC096140]|uniref:non-ribosomal peptide synthetase n=1 Tax=Kitasatospora sp. NPDC096140 TaxID=3155425 RepID=UPI0033252208